MLLFPVYECSRKQKSTAKLFLLLLLFLALSQTLSAKGCCNKKLVPSAVNRTGSKLKKAVLPSCTVFTLGLGLGLFFLPPFGGDNVIRQVFKDIVSHFPREVPSLKREKDVQPVAPPPPLPPPPPSPEDNPSKKSWYQKPMVQVLLVVLVALVGLALLVYYWPFLNAAYIFLVNRYLLGYPFDPAAAAAATAAAFAAAETGGSTSGGGASGSAGGGGGGDQGAPAGAAAAAAAGAMPPEGSTSTSNNNSSSSSMASAVEQQQQQQQQEPQLQFLHPIPPISPAFDGPIWRDPPRTPLLIPRDAADPRQLAEYHHHDHPGGPSPKKPKRRSREQQQQQHQQKYHFGTPVPPSHS